MKKITYLLLAILPLLGFAQTFDFTNSDDGWSTLTAMTTSTNPTFLSLNLTEASTNPAIGNLAAGVDGVTNVFASITLKNSDAAGPTFLRVSYPKAAGGRVYKQFDITAGDTEYKTYNIELTNADWGNDVPENDVKLHFKAAGNVTYTVPAGGVTVELDKVEFVDVVPRPEQSSYEFNSDGDAEGWSTLVDATTSIAGGYLVLTPTGGAPGKVTNSVNSLDANANSHFHIVYKNLSPTNNQIRFQFRSSVDSYVAYIGQNASINQSMSAFETISIDLESAKPTEWSDTAQDFQVAVRNTGNGGNAADANGNFEIDRIVFNSSPTLSITDLELFSFALYPNPAKNVLNINSTGTINKVDIFNIIGKKVLTADGFSNNAEINVSNLNSGIYLVKISDQNNNSAIKKLILK